jgi:hypothetical protein
VIKLKAFEQIGFKEMSIRGKACRETGPARLKYSIRSTPEVPKGGHFMNKATLTLIIPFALGLILGILCTIYLPQYARPYLPESMVGKEPVVKGIVVAKEKKVDAVLLTVNTPEGALLATFKNKADEVNLLINEKDEIQFILPKYLPFIDDPKILRVVKEQQAVPPPTEASGAPAGKNTKEMTPLQQMKLPGGRGSSAPSAGDKKTGQ